MRCLKRLREKVNSLFPATQLRRAAAKEQEDALSSTLDLLDRTSKSLDALQDKFSEISIEVQAIKQERGPWTKTHVAMKKL
jgi:hypothetical protein